MNPATRKRGRPKLPINEDVIERRRLSKQRSNARRSNLPEDVPCESSHGNPPSEVMPAQVMNDGIRKRGRPRLAVTPEVMERRRLSKRRSNSPRSHHNSTHGTAPSESSSVNAPSEVVPGSIPCESPRGNASTELMNARTRKRGRPRLTVTKDVVERRRISKQTSNSRRSRRSGLGESVPFQDSPGNVNSVHVHEGSADGTSRQEFSNIGAPVTELSTDLAADNGTVIRDGTSQQEYSNIGSPIAEISTVSAAHNGMLIRAAGETNRKRSRMDKKKKEFDESNFVLDLGEQDQTCGFCHAHVWAAEFTGRHVGNGPKGYSICCGKGKVQLPMLRDTPLEMRQLLTAGDRKGRLFFNKIRIYNNIFAFCSFGGSVDDSINNGKGPYVFRVTGQVYHNLGGLVPPDGRTPKFAQLYMYDGQEAINHRLNFTGKRDEIDADIVETLDGMLKRDNVLVGIFKQLPERFTEVDHVPIRLRLFEKRKTDGRFHNIQTEDDYEFAGLVVDNNFANHRDIVVHHKRLGLQPISELHPCYMSLQYPLLFPHGEDGYRTNIKHRNVEDSDDRRNSTVSICEYYAFRTQYRSDEGHTLLLGGRLFLQFLVDAWCSVERTRLLWVQRNQSLIRSNLYNNIVDSLRRGDLLATDVGRRVILPSSFTGGYRYMQQNFQDSLAVCKEYGHPDLFITFTCNPKWDEIQAAVRSSGSHDASVRPDIVARVFKMKLDAMLADFTKKSVLGRVLAVVYTIEFQKRGLPHAHIVLWFADGDKLISAEDIDRVICAEIPDKEADPVGYRAVSQFMMHGPCGSANPKCPCMVKGQCTKYYPKDFNNNTFVDSDGYAIYKRRDTKCTVECKKISLDNRHVVPYHRGLLVKYQGHINVEWCNRSLSIKYLFKYIGKGPDTATVVMEKEDQDLSTVNDPSTSQTTINYDEVKGYLSCRYVSAAEACWRLFQFPIHHREPFVQRLFFHLENEQEVRFRDDETLPEVIRRVDPDGTMFIQWFITNQYDELGRDLTFVKFPTKFRWDASARCWFRRKQRIDVVGRMVYAHPASGERFYIRLLLNIVTGATKFEEVRMVDGIVYSTYKEACFHRGLLESDKEWHIALDDASVYATAPQLRDLFVTLLVFCEVSNPGELWDKHWSDLADDIQYRRRKLMNMPNLNISVADKQMLALEAINNLLKQFGKKVADFPGLPDLNTDTTTKYKNELLLEEIMYDREELTHKAKKSAESLNHMQRVILQQILESVELNRGGLHFVYGPGGTGKTFLWSAIISHLRSEGRIVLAVAASGIASLLIDGGRTAHSRFKIPINIDEFSCCEIKQNTYLAELICKTSLVIWDEAPMSHRYIFEAVDRTFRDIRTKVNPDASSLPFGGLTMLLGGDFRQILPVIPRKGREEVVAASISKSKLWQDCTVFHLTENMRIEKNVPPVTIDGRKVAFRDWVLALGDGSEKTFALGDDLEPCWIKLPEEVLVKYHGDALQAIITEIYSDLKQRHGDLEYIRDRAILTPLNEYVESVNNEVLNKLPGELKIYKSCDSICKGALTSAGDELLYPPEYLNSLKFSGMPNHEIQVKVGAPMMLLRNLNPKKGLCNGTRLIITRCYQFLIEARIITGKKIGDITYIPRINMSPADKTLPFLLKRKQFPISACYAMTVNKSQGQTVKNVGLYLPQPVFGHGQIYVAVSRVTSPDGLKVVCVDEDETFAGYTKNIVYHEIFDDIM